RGNAVVVAAWERSGEAVFHQMGTAGRGGLRSVGIALVDYRLVATDDYGFVAATGSLETLSTIFYSGVCVFLCTGGGVGTRGSRRRAQTVPVELGTAGHGLDG